MLHLIVAMSKQGAIGLDGKLPWHHSGDLKHFKEVTWNQKVLMGRKTLAKLPRVLPNREIYCVTRQKDVSLPSGQEVTIINDFEGFCQQHQHSDDLFYIAGGASIYQVALPYVSEMIASVIHYDEEADTFFPYFVQEGMRRSRRENKEDFEILYYRR